jgi:hypothetical protein
VAAAQDKMVVLVEDVTMAAAVLGQLDMELQAKEIMAAQVQTLMQIYLVVEAAVLVQ